MIKKVLVFVICSLIMSFSADALPGGGPAPRSLLLDINSELKFNLRNVNIKINNTNNWISLGTISSGNNKFIVPGTINVTEYTLRIEEPNTQKMVVNFQNPANNKELQLTIHSSKDRKIISLLRQISLPRTVALEINLPELPSAIFFIPEE